MIEEALDSIPGLVPGKCYTVAELASLSGLSPSAIGARLFVTGAPQMRNWHPVDDAPRGAIYVGGYTTVTLVVRGQIADDFSLSDLITSGITIDKVMFAVAHEGVTDEATKAGADPTSWPDS